MINKHKLLKYFNASANWELVSAENVSSPVFKLLNNSLKLSIQISRDYVTIYKSNIGIKVNFNINFKYIHRKMLRSLC